MIKKIRKVDDDVKEDISYVVYLQHKCRTVKAKEILYRNTHLHNTNITNKQQTNYRTPVNELLG